jgi:hypothetical protein
MFKTEIKFFFYSFSIYQKLRRFAKLRLIVGKVSNENDHGSLGYPG